MKAVIWTDVIQFAVYLVGRWWLFLIVGKFPGGWSGLWDAGSAAHKFRLFDFISTSPSRTPSGRA